jgi:hypothetical protein
MALREAISEFPHDWRTHYRLARALQIVNRSDEAQKEAEIVRRIRELLDPLTLGHKLDAAFAHLDQPEALATLADACARVGLTRLADAWRALTVSQREDRPTEKQDARLEHAGTPTAHGALPQQN